MLITFADTFVFLSQPARRAELTARPLGRVHRGNGDGRWIRCRQVARRRHERTATFLVIMSFSEAGLAVMGN